MRLCRRATPFWSKAPISWGWNSSWPDWPERTRANALLSLPPFILLDPVQRFSLRDVPGHVRGDDLADAFAGARAENDPAPAAAAEIRSPRTGRPAQRQERDADHGRDSHPADGDDQFPSVV